MRWSEEFKRHLRDTKDGAYAPMFRLQIGSTVVAGSHVADWELDSGNKVLEILSHPGTNTFADMGTSVYDSAHTAMHGKGTWLEGTKGSPYFYCVGLTGDISMGAQSIQPRTFMYTGATLSVGVTRFAAQLAKIMPPGCLARLQMKFDPTSVGETDTEFTDIYIGQYQGFKWNGSKYTLSFVDALQAVKQRYTSASVGDEDEHAWFAGTGSKATLREAWPGGTAFSTRTNLSTNERYDSLAKLSWGRMYKKNTGYRGTRYHITTYPPEDGTTAPGGSEHGWVNWAKLTNTDGGLTYLKFNNLGAITIGGVEYGRFLEGLSDGSNGPLPGYVGIGAANTHDDTKADGIDVDSELTSVCVIHGSPISELINTIYIQGYSQNMVPGLFAKTWGACTSLPRPPVNTTDIQRTVQRFSVAYEMITGKKPVGAYAPFRHIVTAPQGDGLSYMLKLFGKWGVFPRFKAGGYSVGFIHSASDEYYRDDFPAEALIFEDDIEGAEVSQRSSQLVGGFQKITGTTTDLDHASTGFVYSPFDDEYPGPIDGVGGREHFGAPRLGTLTVKTHDVAAGSSSEASISSVNGHNGQRFLMYYREQIYRNWFQGNRIEASFRLRGLEFAGLAPGDKIHVCIPTHETDTGFEDELHPWGPHETRYAGGGNMRHMLDTVNFKGTVVEAKAAVNLAALPTGEGTDLRPDPQTPWTVHSVQVDWVGCRVSLVCTRISDLYSSEYFTQEGGMQRYSTLHGAGLAVHTLKDD